MHHCIGHGQILLIFSKVFIFSSWWAIVALAQTVAPSEELLAAGIVLTPVEMFLVAAGLSAIGGLAASFREENLSWGRSGSVAISTSVLGASLSMIAYYWVSSEPALVWFVVGMCGLLSLGGMGSIDWALKQAREKFRKVNEATDE